MASIPVPKLPTLPRLPKPPVPRPVRRRPGRWVSGPAAPPGGRACDVYLPAGYRAPTRLPVVVLLHGCVQTPAAFVDATRFTAVADRNGFLLVLPHQETRHHPQRCWRWYEGRNQHRGQGEPRVLAALTAAVLAERRRWGTDPGRVYVAGLSAGGAMAMVLAATYPDLFAAAGVHSAPAYRSAAHGGQALAAMAGRTSVPAPDPGAPAMAPLIVVQGGSDTVVRPGNAERIAGQWLDQRTASGVPPGRSRVDTGTTAGRTWTRTRWYGPPRRRDLELWQVRGLSHAWSGGRPDGSYSDPDGPRAATLMWNFFRAHRM